MQARLENVADVYPLSPTQEGMLFHTISDPGSGVYMDQVCVELAGAVDPASLRAGWQALVARHDALRTAFLWDGLDAPLQVVRERVELDWGEEDWSDLDADARSARLEQRLRDDRARGFDLAEAPLVRLRLIRWDAEGWRLLWSFHHLIADGWSAQVLLDELLALQASDASGALAPAFRYRDFIAWHARQDRARAERFWRERLAGFAMPLRLATPGRTPAPGSTGHRTQSARLDAATSERLRAAASEQRVTLNTAVLAAWALWLARWTRESDVVFGVTTSGRPADLAGIERAVGLFINTLPLRVAVDADSLLGDWLRDLQRRQLEQREFESSPLASVQRWSDVPAGTPLFETLFVFENYPPARREAGPGPEGLSIRGIEFVEHSNYPLAVLVQPGGEGEGVEIITVYDAARFDDAWAADLCRRVALLLEQFATDATRRLGDFETIDDDERRQLRAWAEGPALDPAASSGEADLLERIENVARETPDAPAVVFEGRSRSYAELDRAAGVVAARLRRVGVGSERLVGLHATRSFELIVGMLAIWKAGGAYVPLDPAHPPPHLRGLAEADGIDVVLATEDLRSNAAELGAGVSVLTLGDDAAEPGAAETPQREAADSPDDRLAYMIHTSGSTGRPKGVMVGHRQLLDSTRARMQHYGAPVERFLLLSSYAFDSSVAGIFWTLASGGTLVLPAPGQEQDLDRLLELVLRNRVTHLLCLPTLYPLLLEHGRGEELASLAVAIVAGEACPPEVVAAHFERLPGAALHNEYGPTEATVWCTAHRAEASDARGPVPIGRPIPGARVHLLDAHGRRAAPGCVGELVVGGAGVARGYRSLPELSRERFVDLELDGESERVYRTGDLACHRPDGALLFLGRSDHQLKVRGHRIEAGAVEAAIRAHPGVGEAVVTGRPAPRGSGHRLVAYVQTTDGAGGADRVGARALREHLQRRVPDFMVPDAIVTLASLPRLPNGKIDTRALPDPSPADGDDRPADVAPRDETERVLAGIWSELLGVDAIGVHDDYFALGGDSILSIQLISRARQAGVHLEPRHVAEFPTIAGLAVAARAAASPRREHEAVVGPVPLAPIQHWFFEQRWTAPQHWNQSNSFEVPADVDVAALGSALRACVAHHDQLRACFERRDGGWQQRVGASTDEGSPILEVVDAASDAEVERTLAATQAGLDLASGRPIRAVLIRRGAADPALLLIAVHHLVIDAASWAILMDDVETLYRAHRDGRPAALPPRTSSYRDWVSHLADPARRPDESEGAFWLAQAPTGPLPIDRAGADAGDEGSSRSVRVALDAERTQSLLTRANDAYRTRAEDLLVTALVRTVVAWAGDNAVHLALESHGRPDDVEGFDLSRTVGWFTASYPLTLRVRAGEAPGRALMSIKEQLRAVPGGGIGYGVRRYLAGDPALADRPAPPLLFNYLGQAPRRAEGSAFAWRSAEEATSRDRSNPRSHPIEVVCAVRDGRLGASWYFSERRHERATIESLARAFADALGGLIDHCLSDGAGGVTPSDFPEAELDQDELDRFLDSLS